MSFLMDCEIMPEERCHGHELEIPRLDVAGRAADEPRKLKSAARKFLEPGREQT
jgi:hypothetical protein